MQDLYGADEHTLFFVSLGSIFLLLLSDDDENEKYKETKRIPKMSYCYNEHCSAVLIGEYIQ